MTGISRESERMSLLVDDLLLLARLDEGRPLERRPVELERVVGDAVETARTVEPDRPIELHAEPAVVLGDRDRLRQVVDNLLGNVRAAHAGGQRRSQVRVAGGTASARDRGRGLGAGDEPPRTPSACSSASTAPTPSRSRASGGVGLGLSIVAAVAEAHGGAVVRELGARRGDDVPRNAAAARALA